MQLLTLSRFSPAEPDHFTQFDLIQTYKAKYGLSLPRFHWLGTWASGAFLCTCLSWHTETEVSTFILWNRCESLSRVRHFVTPWTVAHQAPLSIGFPRQEYWSGYPCPPPRDLPNPGTEPGSPALQADSLPSEPPGNPSVVYKTEGKSIQNCFLDITA